MILTIPCPQDESSFSQVCKLDGIDYKLNFLWNQRDNHWYMSIYRDGVAVIESTKVVSDMILVWPGREQSRMPGMIVSESGENTDDDPGLSDLGKRVMLTYYDSSEFVS